MSPTTTERTFGEKLDKKECAEFLGLLLTKRGRPFSTRWVEMKHRKGLPHLHLGHGQPVTYEREAVRVWAERYFRRGTLKDLLPPLALPCSCNRITIHVPHQTTHA